MTSATDLYNPGAVASSTVAPYWQHKQGLVVGFSTYGCDFVCTGNGVVDDALVIQAAIDYAYTNNIRDIFFLTGTYYCFTGLTIPKQAFIRMTGAFNVIFKAAATMNNLIFFGGNSYATLNTDLAHGFEMFNISVDAANKANYAFKGFNASSMKFVDTSFSSSVVTNMHFSYTGVLPPTGPSVPGGIWIVRTIIGGANGTKGIYMEYQTQCWIDQCWFEGADVSMTAMIHILSCNKIKINNNEFNTATAHVILEDTGATACQNITLGAGNIFSGTPIISDLTTNIDSNNPLFGYVNDAKGITRTGGGTITLTRGGDVNTIQRSSTAAITYNLPTAIKVGLKYRFLALDNNNPITIVANGSDYIIGRTGSGGSIASSGAVGAYIEIECIATGIWNVVSSERGWTLGGNLVGHDTRTGAGAIGVSLPLTYIVTTGANALTLADGIEGQLKTMWMQTDGGDGTLTPTNRSGYSTITFTAVGQTCTLLFTNGAWTIYSYFGVTIA